MVHIGYLPWVLMVGQGCKKGRSALELSVLGSLSNESTDGVCILQWYDWARADAVVPRKRGVDRRALSQGSVSSSPSSRGNLL